MLEINQGTPLIFATDGIKDVLTLNDINAIVENPHDQLPTKIIEKLTKKIYKRKTQKDDISVLVRIPKN